MANHAKFSFPRRGRCGGSYLLAVGVAVIFLSGSGLVHAQVSTCNWATAVSGNWSDSTKWDCGFVPGAGNTANITVAGTYTVSLTGNATVANLTLGTSSGSDQQTLSNSGFVLQVTSSGVINANGLLSLAGTYAGNLSVSGAVVWSSGRMDSTGSTTINAGATLTINGTGTKTIERTVTNDGTIIWSDSGGIQAGSSVTSLIDNNNLFEIQGDAALSRGNLATFNVVNDGTMRKTIATGTTTFGVSNGISFTNNGAIDIQTGTIAIWGGGNIAGTTTISAGAALQFTNGSTLSGATVTGDGLVKHTGGFLAVNGSTQIENMEMSSTTTGSGTLTITRSLSWTGGTFSSGGTTIIAPAASLVISGTSTKGLERTLRNDGVISWTGTGGIHGGNATTGLLDNNNLFEIQNDASITRGNLGNFHLLNDGTLRKTTATGTTEFGLASQGIQITNNGQIDLQSGTTGFYGTFSQGSGAAFLLNGGNAASNPALTIAAGSFGGSGTFTGSVVNNALVHPGLSPGLLTISGNYTQGSTGKLAIELDGTTAGTTYDQLAVGGTATLDGTLEVTYPGGFVPADNDIFSIVTYANVSGDFATKTGLTPTPSVTLTPSITASSYDLTTTALSADLSITKSASPEPVPTGDPLTYTIGVSNAGPDTATSVTVTDTLPTGVTYISASGTGWSCLESTGTVTCTLTSLAVTSASPITIAVTAPGTTGTITNTATISATEADPNTANNSASATTTVIAPSADLSITKSAAPEPVQAGASLTYTIGVSNAGPDPATSVTVSDTLPAGVSYVSSSGTGWSCFESTGTVTCTMASLGVGSAGPITISVLAPGTAGTITNTATVSAAETDPNSANDSSSAATTVVVPSADLSITKSAAPEPVQPGGSLTYTIGVTNAGPNTATSVAVSDTLPAGVSYVSSSGTGWSCSESTGTVTCTMASLAVGIAAPITISVLAPGTVGTITNTASVSAAESDPNAADNMSSASTTVASATADLSISKLSEPPTAEPGAVVTYDIIVRNLGPAAASMIDISDTLPAGTTFISAEGQGWSCSEMMGTVLCTRSSMPADSISGVKITVIVPSTEGTITNTATVSSMSTDPVPGNNSATAQTTISACPSEVVLLSPAAGSDGVPVDGELSWSGVGATTYTVYLGPAGGGCEMELGAVTGTSISYTGLESETDYEWRVVAQVAGCPATTSACSAFRTAPAEIAPCEEPLTAPALALPGQVNSMESYRLSWSQVDRAERYEIHESNDRGFEEFTTHEESNLTRQFEQVVSQPTPFFYRVRGMCGGQLGPFSDPSRIVVVPLPDPAAPPVLTTEFGNDEPIRTRVFVPFPIAAFPDAEDVSFVARMDRSWARVVPEVGVMPVDGFTFDVIIDPSDLPVGTSTATLIVEFPQAAKTASNGSTTSTTPVSVTLVTPVTAGGRTFPPPPNALLIPAVARAEGIRSDWQSNVRLTNTSASAVEYDVTFNETGRSDSTAGKHTRLEAKPGQTIAFDDIVRQWFGQGSLGDGVVGLLEIRPREEAGKRGSQVTSSLASVASSRSFNTTSEGTFGQFIPALPFESFIGMGTEPGPAPVIGLLQIEQSDRARTNFGLLEGAGSAATVQMRVFDDLGEVVEQFEIVLGPGDHRQLNGFLAQRGIELDAGRVEMEVVAGAGRITGYASVVDNLSGDPIFVAGEDQSAVLSARYVVPGVANFTTERNRWRTSMSLLNLSEVPTPMVLTFYPQGHPDEAVSVEMTIEGKRLLILEELLSSEFGMTNVGGAVHVTTPADSALLVSAKTFDSPAEGGTKGQFIQGVRVESTFGIENRPLQILQLEESARYRSNLGIAEVTGNTVSIRVSASAPGTIVAPSVVLDLEPFEFTQLNSVLSQLGFSNVYNGRISIEVIGGTGRITAYGSVVDNRTQDPTFVPAQ